MLTEAKPSLFAEDAVFINDKTDKKAVISEVYQKLLDRGYVKGDFIEHILDRERQYPTGIDTSPISKDLPNIAIPHTEGEFVNARLIVPIELTHLVEFNNMIEPDKKLSVKFLFMILNNDPEGQANILAQIMDFLNSTPVDQLKELFNSQSTEEIYQFMVKHFNK
ncbi:PTS sugar transporter subunit IIA [Lactobacillus sp.]|uniref:PTS sugar transporter subunit IIA n=1 Tax=Lactobacillus sp. TaxID=1591 RepID=UPI003EF6081D